MLTRVAAVLADQSVDLAPTPWFNFQLDLARAVSGSSCRARFSGARASRWRSPSVATRGGEDPGPPGRRRLRGQHGRRHRRVADAPACSWSSGSAASTRSRSSSSFCAVSALLVLEPFALAADRRSGLRFAVRRHAADRGRRGRRRVLRADINRCPACSSPTAATPPRGVGQRRHHLRRRGVERVGRRLAPGERRPQLPQRRQGAGVERAAGHAAAAHARPPDDARARRSRSSVLVIGCGAGVTAGAVSIDPARRARDHRRDRAARAARSSPPTSASTTSTSSATRRCTCTSTTRGTSC